MFLRMCVPSNSKLNAKLQTWVDSAGKAVKPAAGPAAGKPTKLTGTATQSSTYVHAVPPAVYACTACCGECDHYCMQGLERARLQRHRRQHQHPVLRRQLHSHIQQAQGVVETRLRQDTHSHEGEGLESYVPRWIVICCHLPVHCIASRTHGTVTKVQT